MKALNPYLNFNGNTEQAFNFYKSVFGGDFSNLQRFSNMPNHEKLSETDKNKIMHISLPLANGIVLMGSDTIKGMGRSLNSGNNFYLSIDTEGKDETDRLFNALAKDGEIQMPVQNTFWGSYMGMLTDAFGIQWIISNN